MITGDKFPTTSGRITNVKQCARVKETEGRALLKRKKAAISTIQGKAEAKGRVGDPQGDDPEELDVAVNPFFQFPKLRMER